MAKFGVYMSSGSGAMALNLKLIRKFLYLPLQKHNYVNHHKLSSDTLNELKLTQIRYFDKRKFFLKLKSDLTS